MCCAVWRTMILIEPFIRPQTNLLPWADLNSGLKIIFERWPVVLTGQTNFSSIRSCFLPVKILKILILKNTPIKVAQNSFQHIQRLRFCCVIDFNHSLSIDASIMVPKNCPITSEHVGIIFVTQ